MTRVLPSRWVLVRLVLASTLGTLTVALLTSACVARFFPAEPHVRFAIAYCLVIPLWVSAMCLAFVARRPVRVEWLCIGLSLLELAALMLG